MRRSNRSMLLAAGVFAVAALSMPALARDNTTTELSAQGMSSANPNAPPPRGAPRAAPRQAPVRIAPAQRAAPIARPQNIQRPPRTNVQRNIGAPPPHVVAPIAPPAAGPRIIATPRQGNRAFTPRGANSNVVRAARIRSAPARGVGRTSIQGRNYSVWRSNYRIRRGGGWRTFVALGALGTLAVGASQYYPYAYIQAPEPYCDGRTEDGCQLVWEDVETLEGGAYAQCVAYCPWQ